MAKSRGVVVDLANVVIFAGGALLGVLYIISPDLRRNIEIYVTNRSAWYYLGKYVERPGDPEHGPGGWEGAPEGCKEPERTMYHVAWDEDRPFDQNIIKTLPGTILISFNEKPAVGREGHINDDRFSDNPIVALAPQGRCYFVKQVARRPIGEPPACDGVKRASVAYWAEMTFITCD